MSHNLLHRSWAEINLDNIAHNVRTIRRKVHKSCEILGVVKADAYGHGVSKVVPVMLANGVTRLAVTMLDEAIELRAMGIDVPILVMSYTDPGRAEEILRYKITQTVYTRELASALSETAVKLGINARIHIKVDTGMGRLGFMAGYEAIKAITWIRTLPGIIVEGLYTHFASADEEDTAYTDKQFELFMGISRELDRIGLHIPLKHVCNSAATMRFASMHLDMVRPGLIVYGMVPAGCPGAWLDLRPAMSLKSNIILVKKVPPGTAISYGRKFVTKKESLIGTIPIGYADGYSRRLSGKAEVMVHGARVPVAGSICMDNCMVDLTGLPEDNIQIGDEIVLFGSQLYEGKEGMITVDELAGWLDSINYEVTCLIGRRVPRAYHSDGMIRHVQSYLLD